jgi:hypothetical protein
MKSKFAMFVGLLLAGANAMACYTVYDGSNRILYRGLETPIDMSLPLRDGLARRFPAGSQMVFDQTRACGPVGVAQVSRPGPGEVPLNTIELQRTARTSSLSKPAPLFTDRDTAERAGLPHTQVATGVVVVPAAAADRAMNAAVTVLPSSTFAAAPRAPDTTVLGAGPAQMGSTRPTTRPRVVITELRDPPMTLIERDGTLTITR